MQLNFVKMEGLGNDFMVVEWPRDLAEPEPDLVRRWGDRRLGVGFDSLLIIDRGVAGGPGPSYRVFNADGGRAQQCGNGARCIASYLAPAPNAELRLASAAGIVEARVLDDGLVSVNLGVPNFRPAALPFRVSELRERYELTLQSGRISFGAVSMGNPHAVVPVDSVETVPIGILGPELAAHPDFPESVNVGFMERVSANRIRLRVYERGVGETRACGTGAAAAVAVGRTWGQLADEVEVSLPGGLLIVRWPGPGAPLWQTGPTTRVYEGRIEL